ncbi:MAG: M24 family metallopeptidase [Phototrophicaceae bacterium]
MSLEQFKDIILPLRQQAEVRDRWLEERLDTVIPNVINRSDFDMWLIICSEYNEDPVIMSMLPATAMSARRLTILVFAKNEDGTVERFSVDRYGHGAFFETQWQPEKEDQWACLARLVKERDPKKIGVNYSSTFAFGNGLTYSEAEQLHSALGADLMARCASAEALAVGWLETRIEAEMAAYPTLVAMGHALIAEAFSKRVIQPGVTTTDDVIWYMRQKIHNMGLQAWFQPACQIQAPGQSFEFLGKPARKLILPGDMLWCDVGFYYLGLATDQQNQAYVLKSGEKDAPEGLKSALHDTNHLQDIHMRHMKVGATGNEILEKTLNEARIFEMNAQIYSHPLGFHGHAAGPTIGLWDMQGGVPGRGDYPVYDHTAYSIELNLRKAIPEWDGQEVRIQLEEDAIMKNGKMHWLDGRQHQAFHLIG